MVMDSDEAWRVLLQSLGILILLLILYKLEVSGLLVRITSRRGTVPTLLVAVCDPKNAPSLQDVAVRRGVVEQRPSVDETEDLPSRGEHVAVLCGPRRCEGVVLEDGPPRANVKMRDSWANSLAAYNAKVLLLPVGDSVIATVPGRKSLADSMLRWRLPRFLRKACKRRASMNIPPQASIQFHSWHRQRVLAIVPVSPSFATQVLPQLPESEKAK